MCQCSNKCVDKENIQFLRSHVRQKNKQTERWKDGKSDMHKWVHHLNNIPCSRDNQLLKQYKIFVDRGISEYPKKFYKSIQRTSTTRFNRNLDVNGWVALTYNRQVHDKTSFNINLLHLISLLFHSLNILHFLFDSCYTPN